MADGSPHYHSQHHQRHDHLHDRRESSSSSSPDNAGTEAEGAEQEEDQEAEAGQEPRRLQHSVDDPAQQRDEVAVAVAAAAEAVPAGGSGGGGASRLGDGGEPAAASFSGPAADETAAADTGSSGTDTGTGTGGNSNSNNEGTGGAANSTAPHHHHLPQQQQQSAGAAPQSGAPSFAAPSSFLRPIRSPPPAGATLSSSPSPASFARGAAAARTAAAGRPGSRGSMGSYSQRSVGKDGPLDKEQREGLRAIRAFLKVRTSYDVLPLSFRLIVFDTALLVKKSLNILLQNGIVSAPLWDSRTSTFAGLLTTSDYINVIQYYWQNPDAFAQIDQFRLNSLPDVERAIGVQPLETVSIHPDRPLYEACRRMLESKARRIPLVDFDDETQRPMVVSVVTQYRILKFVAVNVQETAMLRKPLKELGVGTYGEPGRELLTARMDTPVMDVIHNLVKRSISSVPILDKDGTVVNVFEAVDVISLIKGGVYDDLNLTVGEALLKRSDDFAGIYTCTLDDRLDAIFDTIRRSRVHRFVVIDEAMQLKGVLTLSDILEYVLLEGEEGEDG